MIFPNCLQSLHKYLHSMKQSPNSIPQEQGQDQQIIALANHVIQAVQTHNENASLPQIRAIFRAFQQANSFSKKYGYGAMREGVTVVLEAYLLALERRKYQEDLVEDFGIFLENNIQFVADPVGVMFILFHSWEQYPRTIIIMDIIDSMIMMASLAQKSKLPIFLDEVTLSILCRVGENRERREESKEMWACYIQILRSCIFKCTSVSTQFYYSLVLEWILPDLQLANQDARTQDQKEIVCQTNQIKTLLPHLIKSEFHVVAMLLRGFSAAKEFFKKDSILHQSSNIYPSVNYSQLTLKVVEQMALTNDHDHNALDCMMICISLLQMDLPRSHNYNQILEFVFSISIYWLSTMDSPRVKLYLGQAFSMLSYTNVDWFIKYCRQNKYLPLIVSLFVNTFAELQKGELQEEDEELVIRKRMIAGFCSLLTLEAMETTLQEGILKMFPIVINMLQSQYGYEGEGKQETKLERKGNAWCEQYYNKNPLTQFEKVEQISMIKVGMKMMQQLHPSLFESMMENFDEKEMMMWIIELEDRSVSSESMDSSDSQL